jgi:hypothetical protein
VIPKAFFCLQTSRKRFFRLTEDGSSRGLLFPLYLFFTQFWFRSLHSAFILNYERKKKAAAIQEDAKAHTTVKKEQ